MSNTPQALKLYKATITYRGWSPNHLTTCFRLDTLIEHNGEQVVVLTVGMQHRSEKRCLYETIASKGKLYGSSYVEADRISRRVPFESRGRMTADKYEDLPSDADNVAAAMHHAVVDEIAKRSLTGSLYEIAAKLTMFVYRDEYGELGVAASTQEEARDMLTKRYPAAERFCEWWKFVRSEPSNETRPCFVFEPGTKKTRR